MTSQKTTQDGKLNFGSGFQEEETDRQPQAAGFSYGLAAFGASALIYLAVCVSVLHHSVFWLLGYVADDAFYYLQIARHLAVNGRSTFDGLNPTNGYHPGWMLLMTVCAKLVPDRAALLKVSLGMEFGLHFATSLLLIPIIRRISGPVWPGCIAAVWLLNPLPFTLALFGVEAPLAQFTVAVAIWAYLTLAAPFLRPGVNFWPPSAHLILFGFSLALAFYGRTDQALLGVIALAMVLGLIQIWTAPGLRLIASLRTLSLSGGAFAAGVLPWYLFSYAACGTLTQDSGAMKTLWHAQSIHGWNIHTLVFAPLKFTALFWLATPFAALVTGSFPAHIAGMGTALLLLGLVVGGLWRTARSIAASSRLYSEEAAREEQAGLAPLTVWLGSATLISGVLYGILIDGSQFWYLASPSFTLFLLLTGWATHLAELRLAPGVQMRLAAALFAAALGLCFWHRVQMTPPYPWQRDVYLSQPRFEALVPAQARIGCFDAGIPAYFSPRTIINLDGLVNHTAVHFWKTDTLDRYVSAQGIGYIANEPATMAHAQQFAASPIPLTLIATAPLQGWSTGRRCFWKIGRSAPLPLMPLSPP